MLSNLIKNVVPRILAIGLISWPLAHLSFLHDQEIKRNSASLSQQELLNIVTRSTVDSLGETFLMFLVLGIATIAVVESVAFVFRWIFEKFMRTEDSRMF